MTLGSRVRLTSLRLLGIYGDTTTFTRVTPGAFVPSTGALGSSSTTTYTAQGVSSQFKNEEINNETVLYGDMKYLILPVSAVPAVGDTCVIGSITYRIMSVIDTNLQGVHLLYTLQLRV